jgi:streptogramin lyase
MTNAGKSGASYPCTTPKNQWGYYNCPGALKRIYRLMVDNTWMQMQEAPFTQQFEPTQNQTDVLSDGDPLASTRPTIIDGDAFEGNFGAPFVWQYFSRIYQLNQ